MKLSEKGFKALLHKVRSGFFWGYEDDIHKAKDHDFKPDDFQDAVILTVEEAKALLRRIPEFKECGDWQLPIERLKERISKAEGK